MMKKTLLLSVLCLSCVAMTAWTQNMVLNQEDPEGVIAVVGYFCKNDTMTYRQKHEKCEIQRNDTTVSMTVSELYVEEFMIVVTDSTSDGYKMKYIPQSFTLLDTGTVTSQMTINAIALRQLMQSVVCEFTTDEKGLLKSIINWREISDQLKKGVKATCDNLYATIPDLDTTMLRQQLEVILLSNFSTEEGVRNSYMELKDLFGLHGSTYDIGDKEVETEGFSQLISIKVLDDGDYFILKMSAPDQIVDSQETANPNGAEVIVKDLYGFLFFKNGWPKRIYFEESIEMGLVQSIETRSLECTSCN